MTSPTERLDHETESVIEAFAVQEWLNGQRKDNKASAARNDLRQRIRTLIEEARASANNLPEAE